jgi:hypothetical protein
MSSHSTPSPGKAAHTQSVSKRACASCRWWEQTSTQIGSRSTGTTSIELDGALDRTGRHSDDETAFGGRRQRRYLLNIVAAAPTAELLDADRAWARAFWSDLVPCAGGVGSYVNFMADIEQDRVVASYGREKYDRPSCLKAQYDPDNVFHHNVSIRPAATV